jgi:hypothetical protein
MSRPNKSVLFLAALAGVAGSLAVIYFWQRRKKINPKGMTIAYIGDSQLANFSSSGWQNQLNAIYGINLMKVPQNTISGTSNLADSGKTTTWMIDRLKSFYSWGYRPDILIIDGGGNDIAGGSTPEMVVKNIQALVNIAKQNGTRYVYVVPDYRSSKVSLPHLPDKANEIYQRDTYKTMLITDIQNDTMAIPIWEKADASYTQDGLHISDPAKLKEKAEFVGKHIFKKS